MGNGTWILTKFRYVTDLMELLESIFVHTLPALIMGLAAKKLKSLLYCH